MLWFQPHMQCGRRCFLWKEVEDSYCRALCIPFCVTFYLETTRESNNLNWIEGVKRVLFHFYRHRFWQFTDVLQNCVIILWWPVFQSIRPFMDFLFKAGIHRVNNFQPASLSSFCAILIFVYWWEQIGFCVGLPKSSTRSRCPKRSN